ncbi:MAG: anti-sigma factor, partial [Chloroflexota bacterium]
VAALVVLLAGARVVVDRTTQQDQARRDVAALEAVSAATERLLRDPSHRVVELTTTTGGPGGSISWSAHDFVVLTSVLVPPPEGQVYRCWIERDGTRSPVGQMAFAGLTAFWYGSLYEWATTSFGSGVFGVSLEPASGPEGHPPVLSGNLGS